MIRDVAHVWGWESYHGHSRRLTRAASPRKGVPEAWHTNVARLETSKCPWLLPGVPSDGSPSQRQSAIAVAGVLARICRTVERLSLSRRSPKGKFNHRLGSLDKLRLPGRAHGVFFWKIHRPANGLDSTIHAGCGSLTPVAATSTLQRWCRRGGRDMGSWILL